MPAEQLLGLFMAAVLLSWLLLIGLGFVLWTVGKRLLGDWLMGYGWPWQRWFKKRGPW